MKRLVTDTLVSWAASRRRKPLLVRGARQVGKTWAVTDFAERHFSGRAHVVDLERRRDLHAVFSGDLGAMRLLSQLEVVLDSRIQPGRDLLFLDEIQACPRALVALRYFYEDVPQLHVIGAGSLVEFALGEHSFPVGRVRFLNVYPMTFLEFLWATGHDVAAEVIAAGPAALTAAEHQRMLSLLREYLFVGGLPEAVSRYAETGLLREAFQAHDDLIEAYRADFGKYAPRVDRHTLDDVLVGVARSTGRQIKYSRLTDARSPATVKNALGLLERARVLHRVTAVSHVGLPVAAGATSRRFKAILADLGMIHRLSGAALDAEIAKPDLLGMYEGALAEQLVGQELLASRGRPLHYWARAARSSTAEVDYLVDLPDGLHPAEVKSGPSGRLKSLHLFLREYPAASPGYVLSTAPYAELPDQKLVFVPLYYAGALGHHAEAREG